MHFLSCLKRRNRTNVAPRKRQQKSKRKKKKKKKKNTEADIVDNEKEHSYKKCKHTITFTTLSTNSADNKLMMFFFFCFFFIGFDISCKLSPKEEKIWLTFQSLFWKRFA